MCRILISINPEHVENILNGKKKFEYRTKIATKDIESIIVYCTAPTKKVIAEVEIKSIIAEIPIKLWERTKKYSGISLEYFNKYFANRDTAYAYELGRIILYNEPKDLSDFGFKFAPQSFVYINENKFVDIAETL